MRYKMVKLPVDVWNNWVERKEKIQGRIKEATGKQKKVHLTDVMSFYGKRKMYVWDDEVVQFFLKNKKRSAISGVSM